MTDATGTIANLSAAMEEAAEAPPEPDLSGISDVLESDIPAHGPDIVAGTPISGDDNFQAGLDRSTTKSFEQYLKEQQTQQAEGKARKAAERLEEQKKEETFRLERLKAAAEPSARNRELSKLNKNLQELVRQTVLAEELLQEQKDRDPADETPTATRDRLKY